MRSADIRSTFLDFFVSHGHRRVPSSPLIPADPTLLLANAGMNQFKPYFLGESTPEHPRATSVQKCVRTVDIENVGRTTRHGTFFEMLGNFSFGDYFKAEAIAWSWELFTEGFGLDPKRIWITVYVEDDEAFDLWRGVGVPADRIQRLGKADCFWSMGVPGPCGPSSELNYDRGPRFGPDGGPAVDGERFIELWNLVFMQNLRGEGDGKDDYPILGELPAKNIDTGLGMDRLAAILQGVDSVVETDLLAPTLRTVEGLAGRPFPGHDGTAESVSFQVVAEHARTVAFLIADGVLPANEGRGHVLRRLTRRMVSHARSLGIDEAMLPQVTGSVVDNLGSAWPELVAQRSLIEQVTAAEEESFDRTLRQGSRLLGAAITRTRAGGSGTLAGETAFELHDTYGFPIDLTLDAARTAGLSVDEDRFGALLDEQRRRAKSSGRGRTAEALARMDTYREVAAEHGLTDFVGYDATAAEARLTGLVRGGRLVTAAREGEEVEVVLDRTPFYAEAGGQVGDTGTLRSAGGATLEVLDTRPGLDGLHVHRARVTGGEVRTGEEIEAVVDAARRAAVARSHSATHVLHAMLRRVLGDHAKQQGSLVDAGRIRFDFAHFAALGAEQLRAAQDLVNEHLLADPEVTVWHASRAEAEAAGATALFGEKYGEHVRIVDIGDFSRELCGGTHVGHGSQAGPVHILGESSIGSSLRRIEALTGADALRHYDHERQILTELAGLLHARPDDAPAQLRKRLSALAEAERELARLRDEQLADLARRIAAEARPIPGGGTQSDAPGGAGAGGGSGGWLVVRRVDRPGPGGLGSGGRGSAGLGSDGLGPDELRRLATAVLERRAGDGIVVLAAERSGKVVLAASVGRGPSDRGVEARAVLARAAEIVGGGAGGKGALASAGGRHPERLDEALRAAYDDAVALLAG